MALLPIWHDMQRDINRLFAPFQVEYSIPHTFGTRTQDFRPRVDVHEGKNQVIVQAEVPGVSKENLHLEFKDGILEISGKKAEPEKQEGDNYYLNERRHGDFFRRIPLPEGVEPKDFKAHLTDGVLEVQIQKPEKEEQKPLSINIE